MTEHELTWRGGLVLIIAVVFAFSAAFLVSPYFIDYYYGSQPAKTINESIPRYPSEGSSVLVLEGVIKENVNDGTYWLEDYEKNRINLNNEYNLTMPLPWERVKVIGYYKRTLVDFGLTGMYEFVPKRILKVN